MKRSMPICTLFAVALGAATVQAQDYNTGLMDLTISDPGGDRPLQGYLWYPTDAADGFTQAHGNAVWEAIPVIEDAPPVAGKKPLLLLSHGMFGNARNQAWLAATAVESGYLVAAIDHPGTTTFDRDPDQRRMLWQRPRDISRTIDHIVADPRFGEMVDRNHIVMAGHSLGGFTAVALAGGRYDPAKVDGYCADNPGELVCGIFDRWQVAKTPGDRAMMSGDLSDDRIAGFAVFDLGGTQTFSEESLAAISRPLFVIGAPTDIEGLDLDIESRALVAALPPETVRYSEPSDLAHFDFLGVCTDRALAILEEEEPDDVFVCENGRDERRAKHERIAADVLAFFSAL